MTFPRPLPKDTTERCYSCDAPATTEWADGTTICDTCDARIYSHFPYYTGRDR